MGTLADLSPEDRTLPQYCFDVLLHKLTMKETSAPHPQLPPKLCSVRCPLFVTWKKGKQHDLRGCIGIFSPVPLGTGLAQYASISAFEDRRFNPITHDELAHLHCTVSLLVEFERGRDYLDWTVGVHGIRIELRDAATGNVVSATYLPEVASEQGWSKVQAIDSLLRKGGYRGKINDSIRSQISLERYKSARYNASYEQWRASRST
eukprot:m.33540 g.33540  ORF g.33540 m.33540 type:complete len:206 (+) comp14241_c0_seq3:305-922(+)